MKNAILFPVAKLGITLSLLLVLILGVVTPVHAAVFDESGNVGPGETIDDDLFLTGKDALMAGTVNGSLFVSGETITITGTVMGDVFAGGRVVVIDRGAKVGGNLFVGASQVRVAGEVKGTIFGGSARMTLEAPAKVARNLFYGGFFYVMEKGTAVEIDQFIGARQVVINGTTGGDVNIGAVAVEVGGIIGGDAKIEVSEPGINSGKIFFGQGLTIDSLPSGLRISPDASIAGQLTYTSPVDQSTGIRGDLAQPPVFQTPVPEEGGRPYPQNTLPEQAVKTIVPTAASGIAFGLWFYRMLREFLTLFILGCLALWILPAASANLTSVFRKQLFPSFGWGILVTMIGFIAMFIIPVVFIGVGILFSAISLGGLAPAYFGIVGLALTLAAAVFLFLVFTGSMVLGSYAIGEAMLSKSSPVSGGKRFLALFLGVLLIAVTTAIPILGGLWGILVAMTGMGAFWRTWRQRRA